MAQTLPTTGMVNTNQDVDTAADSLDSMFVGAGGLADESALQVLQRVLEIGLRFKSRTRFCSKSEGAQPTEVLMEALPLHGHPVGEVLDELERRYLPGMPNFGSSRLLGFPDAGNSLAGIAGAVLADLLNVNLINSTFCSRIATEMEIAVIRWLREIVGYQSAPLPRSATEVGGMILSGGTMSNYTAVLLARERAFPRTMKSGVRFDTTRVRVLVPDKIGHYTISASLAWCGLGSDNVLRCPIMDFRYDQSALREKLQRCNDDGETPIMVTAYAGDSRTMTIEDFRGVHDIVRDFDPRIWLHCDGCHGTSLAFSDYLRPKLKGVELWDSITLDPHKVLAVPYPASILLLRDPITAESVLTESDLIMRQQHSLGQVTPVLGSKAFHSLRLWLLIKTFGVQGIGKMIEKRHATAQRFAELLKQHPCFLLLNEVSLNSIVFVYRPLKLELPLSREGAENLSKTNRLIYERLVAEGEYYFHSFVATDNLNRLGRGPDFGVTALRYMSGNALLSETTMNSAISYIARLGEQFTGEAEAT